MSSRALSAREEVVLAINTGSFVEMLVNMTIFNQQNLMAWHYEVQDWAAGVTAVQLGEAWWNHVKATYRAVIPSALGATFRSIKVLELSNPSGDYAEFDIPLGEQAGTRVAGVSGEAMPPYVAVGARLVVGTRATRPGQKRYPGVYEGDNSAGVVGSALLGAVQASLTVMTASMLLGAPAATVRLQPIVTRIVPPGVITGYQNITGYLVNQNLTTQNSRKFGRGS